jgi:putative addiction module killer protein
MMDVHQSGLFKTWLRRLKDDNAVARIVVRIRRMEQGNFGDARNVGAGVMELRTDCGPGYRVYYVQRGAAVVILLCGGDKRTQQKDIRRAQAMAHDWAERA